jgi:hypothetical protein
MALVGVVVDVMTVRPRVLAPDPPETHTPFCMPLPPIPVHRGFTPEQQRRRKVVGRTIRFAGIGVGIGYFLYEGLANGPLPITLAGWSRVGVAALILYAMYHAVPRMAAGIEAGGAPIRVTPDKAPRADRWTRRAKK